MGNLAGSVQELCQEHIGTTLEFFRRGGAGTVGMVTFGLLASNAWDQVVCQVLGRTM